MSACSIRDPSVPAASVHQITSIRAISRQVRPDLEAGRLSHLVHGPVVCLRRSGRSRAGRGGRSRHLLEPYNSACTQLSLWQHPSTRAKVVAPGLLQSSCPHLFKPPLKWASCRWPTLLAAPAVTHSVCMCCRHSWSPWQVVSVWPQASATYPSPSHAADSVCSERATRG